MRLLAIVSLIVLLTLLMMELLAAPTLMHVRIAPMQGTGQQIFIPFSNHEKQDEYRLARYQIDLRYSGRGTTSLWVRPDDCIRAVQVNDAPLDLTGYSPQALCFDARGGDLDLAPLLKRGDNRVELTVENTGGLYGIDIRSAYLLQKSTILTLMLMMMVAYAYGRALHTTPLVLALGLAAMGVFFWGHLGRVSFTLNTYDPWHHLHTITYYAAQGIPPFYEGGESHQPPLYYLLAGGILRFLTPVIGENDSWWVVRAVNLAMFELFLLYGLCAMCRMTQRTWLRVLMSISLLAWPANMIHSSRISNDILLYLAAMGFIYHLMRWMTHRQPRQLAVAVLWLAVTIATKASTIVLFIAMAWLLFTPSQRAARLALKQQAMQHRRAAYVLAAILLLTSGLVYGRAFPAVMEHENVSLLYGRAVHLMPTVFNVRDFITFDYTNYIQQPYVPPWETARKELFWNYFLRTLSFGEFWWEGVEHASMMNFLLLAMWLAVGISLFSRRIVQQQRLGEGGYYGIFIGATLLALATVKVLAHGHPWVDARHFYPIMPCLLLVYLDRLEFYRLHNRMIMRCMLAPLLLYTGLAFYHLHLNAPVLLFPL